MIRSPRMRSSASERSPTLLAAVRAVHAEPQDSESESADEPSRRNPATDTVRLALKLSNATNVSRRFANTLHDFVTATISTKRLDGGSRVASDDIRE